MVFPSTPKGFPHKFCVLAWLYLCGAYWNFLFPTLSVIKTQKSQDPMNYVLSGNLAAALKSTIMM